MSDIVKRLRLRASGGPVLGQLDDEAADEIERLKAALYVIERRTSPGNRTFDGCIRDMGFANDYARAALEEGP